MFGSQTGREILEEKDYIKDRLATVKTGLVRNKRVVWEVEIMMVPSRDRFVWDHFRSIRKYVVEVDRNALLRKIPYFRSGK